MPIDPTVFAQVMDFLPMPAFRRCVTRHQGHRKVQSFTCLDQFLCMAFAQLTYRESLRDIVACLRVMQPKLYHMGFRGHIARSTLADANEHRDWRIYADFAQCLISQARALYLSERLVVELDAVVYVLDSTTIDLCLSLFPWAHFQRTKGAIKLHVALNLRGAIPEFIHVSTGKLPDVKALDLLIAHPGAYYVMDKAYGDFTRLYTLHQAHALFVTRARRNMQFQRRYSQPVDKSTGVRCDQTIVLTGVHSATDYPIPLRRIRFVDPETTKGFVFITNDFRLPALDITRLYRLRWQVELFFKWIKQHLRIKAFYGISENAVKTQIWIAISVYVLVAIMKHRLALPHSLYTILQILSVTLFEKRPILQVFLEHQVTNEEQILNKQLEFNDL